MWHYGILAALVLAVFLPSSILLLDLVEFLQPAGSDAVYRFRDFYGAVAVFDRDSDDPKLHNHLVKHGTITHGVQFVDQRQDLPTSYYSRDSGVGRAIEYYRQSLGAKPLRLGVVGLGAGTMAAYGRHGDSITFYEINRDVRDLTESGRWFTFLKDSRTRGAQCDVRLGDARLTMEREFEAEPGQGGPGQNYHLIVLDAFSGDSVPAHLLTQEAFQLYLAHLAPGEPASADGHGGPGGAILVHTSNRYLNLAPLVFGLAEKLRCGAIHIGNEINENDKTYRSNWIIVTRNQKLLDAVAKYGTKVDRSPTIIWTDNYSSLFDLLK
jgi:hypothetical protein